MPQLHVHNQHQIVLKVVGFALQARSLDVSLSDCSEKHSPRTSLQIQDVPAPVDSVHREIPGTQQKRNVTSKHLKGRFEECSLQP